MFGCYRKGDANDPETYVAAITATLARYPQDVILDVTHPVDGLPGTNDFIPTVAEVRRACEAKMKPRREQWAREAADAQRKREREEFEARKNTPEQDAHVRDGLKKLATSLETGIWDDEATGERITPADQESAA